MQSTSFVLLLVWITGATWILSFELLWTIADFFKTHMSLPYHGVAIFLGITLGIIPTWIMKKSMGL